MEPVRTADRFRARLAKQFKLDDVEDVAWNYLVEHKYVEDALVAENGWDELVKAFAELPRFGSVSRRASPPGRTSRKHRNPRPEGTAYERERWTLFEWAVAVHAAETEHVRQFRQEVTGGLLSQEEARGLVESPAARLLPLETLREYGVPLLDHRSSVTRIGRSKDQSFLGFEIHLDPPDTTIKVAFERVILPRERPILAAKMENGEWKDYTVWPGSALSTLPIIGDWLTDQCPWNEREAVWFVLTGEPPNVYPIETNSLDYQWVNGKFRRQTITLTVEPWVSAETVLEVYRWAQHRALGRDQRDLSDKNRHILGFVLQQISKLHRRPPWKELMLRWNAEYGPKWGYTNSMQFARDYRRAEKAIVHPSNNKWDENDTIP